MEEDIKILEEWIEITVGNAPEWVKSDEILKIIDYKQIKAIENLIKGYRELEEKIEKQELAFVKGYTEGGYNQLNVMTSKIKEKIEELENIRWIDLAQEVEEEHHSLEYMRAYRAGKEKALQELMEDK